MDSKRKYNLKQYEKMKQKIKDGDPKALAALAKKKEQSLESKHRRWAREHGFETWEEYQASKAAKPKLTPWQRYKQRMDADPEFKKKYNERKKADQEKMRRARGMKKRVILTEEEKAERKKKARAQSNAYKKKNREKINAKRRVEYAKKKEEARRMRTPWEILGWTQKEYRIWLDNVVKATLC